MNNIFFVESPLNLICAYEAIDFFQIKDYKIVVRLTSNDNNNLQITNITRMLRIEQTNIEYINISTTNRSFLDYLKVISYLLKYFFTFSLERVFIGNIESGFLSLVAMMFDKKKIILIDDGTKTIASQNSFNRGNFYNIFTMYDLPPIEGQKIYKNDFKLVKNFIHEIKIDKNSVLFIGSKISEEGIISESCYLDLINEIFNRYPDKNIIYIPHRGEDLEKISRIENIERVVVKKIGYSVEFLGVNEWELPCKVISFYSTALLTMKSLYNVDVESYFFDYTGSPYKGYIDSIYDFYRGEINVIEDLH